MPKISEIKFPAYIICDLLSDKETTPKRPQEATILCIDALDIHHIYPQVTWATPCNGIKECRNGTDEEGCTSPIWLLPFASIIAVIGLTCTLFCYLQRNTLKKAEDAMRVRPVCKKSLKLIHIALLIENEEVEKISKIFFSEVETHDSEAKAICCLKVCFKRNKSNKKYFSHHMCHFSEFIRP